MASVFSFGRYLLKPTQLRDVLEAVGHTVVAGLQVCFTGESFNCLSHHYGSRDVKAIDSRMGSRPLCATCTTTAASGLSGVSHVSMNSLSRVGLSS